LICASIAYLLDKYVKSEKEDVPISFWKYIKKPPQPQKGKWRRVIAAVFVAACIVSIHEFGYFAHINLAARILIAAVIGLSIGLLTEYAAKVVTK